MRCGTICYATCQGLGLLCKAFYDHHVVNDVLVVRHRHRRSFAEEWYLKARTITACDWQRERRQVLQFCELMDVMLFFETPYYWEVIPHCARHRIKTVLMPMYECCPPQRQLPYQPDEFLCPSLLDLRYYPDRSTYLPVPVEVPWTKRARAQVFVHNAGYGGLNGRNGTGELLDAMRHVKSPLQLLLRSQKPLRWGVNDRRVEVRIQPALTMEELWGEGDVFVFPEKFNGLSLPLQEARAAGMGVLATDRFPMNTWLPREGLIPSASSKRNRFGGCCEFDEAVVRPEDIATVMDQWYNRDLAAYSESGREWARSMSWDVLGPRYLEALSK